MTLQPGILLIGNHAPPYGGVPNHVGNLARYLANVGWRVHVLADVSLRRGHFTVDGYTVHAPTQREKSRALGQIPPRRAIKRISGGPNRWWPHMAGDVARANLIGKLVADHQLNVMSAYHVLKPGLSAAWVKEETGIPLITTVFGEFYARPDEHQRRFADVEYVLRQSSLVLSCSQHCADSVTWLGIDIPVEVMHYGVDIGRFSQAKNLSMRTSAPTGNVVVAYVARMVEEMGLDVLLEALPLLMADARVSVIVAGARGTLYDAACEAAATYGDRIDVRVDLDDDALVTAYHDADIVVAPSSNDRACLGLAIVEAMAAGLPVVACDVGGTAEVVIDGVTGTLVPPRDASELAAALLNYVNDSTLREAHGERGKARAVARFDVEDTNRRCEGLSASLL